MSVETCISDFYYVVTSFTVFSAMDFVLISPHCARCLVWWLSLLFTSCCLQALKTSPDLRASLPSHQVQSPSLLICLAMDRDLRLKQGNLCLVQQAFECFWQYQPALFIITGASLMMPSCAQCSVAEVLFRLFLVHLLSAVSMPGSKPRARGLHCW